MKSQSILIIDQEAAVRESLSLVLSEEGYQCFSTKEKADGLKVLNQKSVGLVILDSQVKGIIRLVEKIKTSYPYIKIIVLSSYAEFEVTQIALARGADDFVLKPLDFDELITRIQDLFMPAAG